MSLWRRHAWLAYVAVFVGVLGHASTELFAVMSGIKGAELSVWRFLLGGGALLLLALALPASRDLATPIRTHGWRLLGLSALGITAGYLFFHLSLDYATVPQVATMVTTVPIFVALMNLAVGRQPISPAKIVSGVCAVLGVAALFTDGYLARLAGTPDNLLGIALALGCALTVGTYTVLVRPIIAIYGALRITAITMSIGAIGLWVVVGLLFGVWVAPARLALFEPAALAALLVIALWNTTITQFLWIGGLAAVPDITRGSYLFFLKPVIAALLAWLVLGQALTVAQFAAIFVITASVFGEILLGRPRPVNPAPEMAPARK
jgi:drug/metabolite transporter (DMT)-like permease